MRFYELVLVLKTSLSEADRKKLLATVTEWLGDKTKIAKEEEWGQKPLAYSIKKELAGFYHKVNLESEAGIAQDFEKKLLQNASILRHILIRTK